MGLDWAKTSKPYDQYERYENLPMLLKRFTFSEKMRIANKHSSRAILFRIDQKQDTALPWCLETFVMLSMEATEYRDGDFKGANEKKAVKIFNTIWSATSEVLQRQYGRFSFVDVLLPMTALTQFRIQEDPWIMGFRYWCVFTNNTAPVYLSNVFAQKMGTGYEDYLLLGYILQLMFLAQKEEHAVIPEKALVYLLRKRFPEATKNLLITREKYVELQRTYVQSNPDSFLYVYSLCPSVQYPFVEDGQSIYFPLPHLLMQSVTTTMMYKVTEGDSALRTKIGKHIWENYLLEIVRDSGAYDEVFPEQKYLHRGSNSYSPDILVRQGETVLFLESKSTVPGTELRIMNTEAHEQNIEKIAGYMVQLSKQMKRFKKYNPFVGPVSENANDYWGVVVVQEDAYIRRQLYYEKAREILKLQESSTEWEWFLKHVKVAGLYEVERLSLTGLSIIDACKDVFGDDPYTYAFMGYPNKTPKFRNRRFLAFKEKCNDMVDDLVKEMVEAGCFDRAGKDD